MTVFGNNDFSIGYEKKGLDEGSIILTVDGERYSGYEPFLKASFLSLLQNLEENDWLYPELFECSAQDVFLSRDAAYSDESIRSDCLLDNIVHGYFDDPAEVDSKIVMYGGFYAFDLLDIVIISNGQAVKFLIRDKVDHRMSEAILQKSELYENILCLLQSLEAESNSS